MNKKFTRPRVFASRCLGFAACRWDGDIVPDSFIENLKPYVSFISECPEAAIGLGIPRDPIRVVLDGKSLRLKQFNTRRGLTLKIGRFSKAFLSSLQEIDGFVLKSRSPSCGLKDVKVYRSIDCRRPSGKTDGFFAKEVNKRFGHLPVETESRLKNARIRERFLTKVFLFARFRKIRTRPCMKSLTSFHEANELLLMSYNQKELKKMGRIVSSHKKKNTESVIEDYKEHLYKAVAGFPRRESNIRVMMYVLDDFPGKLPSGERAFLLRKIRAYENEEVPLSAPLRLLRSYMVRCGSGRPARQTFFYPYPPDIDQPMRSGKP